MYQVLRRFLAVCAASLALSACVGLGFAESDEARLAVAERYPAGRQVAPSAPSHGPLDASGIDEAVAASLPFLLREGRAWMDGEAWVQDGTGCVSCHQVPFALWGQGAAQRAGRPLESDAWTALGADAMAHTLRDDNGRPGIFAPLLLASNVVTPADRREMLRDLVDRQRRDGRWRARGQFPAQRRPLDETDAVITMWNLLAIHHDEGSELAASRGRAIAWLAARDIPLEERSTEWLLARALLDAQEGGGELRTSLVGEVLARQNEDGGWGFLAGDPSDAMTTGQALYALARLGGASAAAADAEGRGVEFLLAKQNDDGSWTVPSRLFSEEPSDRNDYVYDVWGTAWAAIGLSALEP